MTEASLSVPPQRCLSQLYKAHFGGCLDDELASSKAWKTRRENDNGCKPWVTHQALEGALTGL